MCNLLSIWKVIKWLPLLCEWSAKGSIKLVTGCIDAALLWYSATDTVLPTKYKDGVLKFSQVCRGESQHRILEFGSKSTLFSADYRYLLKKQLLAHHLTFFPFTFFFPALLRYNWHITLYKFKVHKIMTAYICKMKVLVTQLWLTLCDPMDCSSLVSSVLEILQARILEWVAITFSRGSSQPRDWM